MKRPILKDFLKEANQFNYSEKVTEYHEALEKYADYLESLLNKT